jgi:hypothetical protein
MRMAASLLCLWPGLPQLWLRGDWRALCVALIFTALFNLLFVASFLWTEMLPATVLPAAWMGLAVSWSVSVWHSCRWWRQGVTPVASPACDRLFIQAQGEYLQGHWFEAESVLQQVLKARPQDAEARLLLATLQRRTRRWEEARQQLRLLERMEGAARWVLEIQRERQLLEQVETEQATDESESVDGQRRTSS